MNLGAPELILIVLVILIFFGAKRIPDLAQGIGKGLKEFRNAMHDVQGEVREGSESKNFKTKN